jgi:hypothetical protein
VKEELLGAPSRGRHQSSTAISGCKLGAFRHSTVIELHGPQVLTMRRIAELIGQQLGRPFPVEQVKRDEDVAALVAMGASRNVAELLNDTWDTFNRHGLLTEQPATPETTLPTRVEDFIREELLPALRGAVPPVDSSSV